MKAQSVVVLSKAVIRAATNRPFSATAGRNHRCESSGGVPAHLRRILLHRPKKEEWELGVLVVRLFKSLESIVGDTGEDARR